MTTEFAGNLAHHLEFGHTLEIVAKTVNGASRFHLNLASAKTIINPDANVGLRISLHFGPSPTLICKARIKGIWGQEQVTTINNYRLPNAIVPGEFFILYILAGEEQFHISLNSHPICGFKYRLPLESLRSLELQGHIQTIRQVDHRTIFPNPWPPIHASDYGKAFSNDSPILYSPGHVVIIKARCFENRSGQFIIKLLEAVSKREDLHFSVRYDEKVVVRNADNQNLEFGKEERHGGFPFPFNQVFKLAIGFTEREFRIAIDGYNFCIFAYRMANVLQNLAGLKITCTKGLQMHVLGVDHVQTGDAMCTGFEKYTRCDYECA